MFFCCEQVPEKGDHVLEMFQSPKSLSVVSHSNAPKLRAFINPRATINNSTTINNISSEKGNKANLNNIVNYIDSQNPDDDYALKKIMKSNYDKLVQEYRRSNKMWTDPQFPLQQKSFGLGKDFQKVVWKRIGEIIKNPVFIGNSIDPNDILQGKIGDCYFLSAISGIAEKDYRIKSIFPNLEINKNGIYMARVLHNGVLKEIMIDDYFPVSKANGTLMCANPSGGNQIWVMLLEKCWAKLYGSYQAIDGGLPNEVLHAFSGAPIFQYLTQKSTEEELVEIFEKMMVSNRLDHVICCGTRSDPDVEDMGLVSGHAYTILQVFEKPRKLLKIRNPWGQKEWIGGASDKDTAFWSKVSNTDKKILAATTGVNDGTFFMFWQDFLNYFQIINICKINDKSNYYYEQLVYPKGLAVYTGLTLVRDSQATFAITQRNSRGKEVPSPRYATSIMILARKIGQNYQYITSFTERNAFDANEQVQQLKAGQYVIYSMLNGRNNKQQATLSCYCQNPVEITPITNIIEDEFLHKVFLDHAKKNKDNQQKIFGNIDVWVCMEIIYESGFGYTVIHVGKSVQTKLGLTFNQEEYTQNNFELLPPYKGKKTIKIKCQSGQDVIVLCKIIPKTYAVEASMPIPNIQRLC